jgi:hypothetical protein
VTRIDDFQYTIVVHDLSDSVFRRQSFTLQSVSALRDNPFYDEDAARVLGWEGVPVIAAVAKLVPFIGVVRCLRSSKCYRGCVVVLLQAVDC